MLFLEFWIVFWFFTFHRQLGSSRGKAWPPSVLFAVSRSFLATSWALYEQGCLGLPLPLYTATICGSPGRAPACAKHDREDRDGCCGRTACCSPKSAGRPGHCTCAGWSRGREQRTQGRREGERNEPFSQGTCPTHAPRPRPRDDPLLSGSGTHEHCKVVFNVQIQ